MSDQSNNSIKRKAEESEEEPGSHKNQKIGYSTPPTPLTCPVGKTSNTSDSEVDFPSTQCYNPEEEEKCYNGHSTHTGVPVSLVSGITLIDTSHTNVESITEIMLYDLLATSTRLMVDISNIKAGLQNNVSNSACPTKGREDNQSGAIIEVKAKKVPQQTQDALDQFISQFIVKNDVPVMDPVTIQEALIRPRNEPHIPTEAILSCDQISRDSELIPERANISTPTRELQYVPVDPNTTLSNYVPSRETIHQPLVADPIETSHTSVELVAGNPASVPVLENETSHPSVGLVTGTSSIPASSLAEYREDTEDVEMPDRPRSQDLGTPPQLPSVSENPKNLQIVSDFEVPCSDEEKEESILSSPCIDVPCSGQTTLIDVPIEEEQDNASIQHKPTIDILRQCLHVISKSNRFGAIILQLKTNDNFSRLSSESGRPDCFVNIKICGPTYEVSILSMYSRIRAYFHYHIGMEIFTLTEEYLEKLANCIDTFSDVSCPELVQIQFVESLYEDQIFVRDLSVDQKPIDACLFTIANVEDNRSKEVTVTYAQLANPESEIWNIQ